MTVPKFVNITYFKLHHRMLVFVGALVVFLTFVFKEQLQEPWKQNAEKIETALYFFTIQISALSAEIKPLNDLAIADRKLDSKLWLPKVDEHMVTLSDEVERERTYAKRHLEAMALLTERLDDKHFESDRDELLKDVDRDDAQLSLSVENWRKVDPARRKDTDNLLVLKRWQALDARIQNVDDLEKRIAGEARSEKDRYNNKTNRAGWWAVVFYCVGWCLGLIGKLSGDDSVVEIG